MRPTSGESAPDPQTVFPRCDAVLVDPGGDTGPPARRTGACIGRIRRTSQPASRQQHVADRHDEYRQAERREAEEAESGKTVAQQLALHHQVRRGRDQCHHAADQRSHAQRHHQPAGCDAGVAGDPQDHRDEDRHHAGRAHHRAEGRNHQHQQSDQAAFVGTGPRNQPIAQPLGDAGSNQRLAEHEQQRNQHDVAIGEARQRLVDLDDAGERQRQDHQQTDHVAARPVGGEHDYGDSKQGQDDDQVGVHAA